MYELSLSLFLFLSSKVHNGLYKLSILRFSQLDFSFPPTLPPHSSEAAFRLPVWNESGGK